MARSHCSFSEVGWDASDPLQGQLGCGPIFVYKNGATAGVLGGAGRGAGRRQRYLFLVLEGARLAAGGMRIALDGVAAVRIGRGAVRALVPETGALSLAVPDSRMSTAHAQLAPTGTEVVVSDLGSTNGTLVNGEPIVRHALRDGDLLELGQTIFLYREIEGAPRGARNLDAGAATAAEPGFATLDPVLALALERLARVAPSPLSILLLGETGTGKEVLARGLHALSHRQGPFVAVNCGAIPQSLVESHLFGHARGAFSGALKDEPGLVRAAQYGTLLLDEIGDLPTGSQAALLRVLQESEVRPVGGTQTVKVDVRIIAATHMPLEDLLERGTFRRDLYARLIGYTFTAPPLRDRRGDLGLLVAALLAAGKFGPARDVRIQGDAARALVRHAWPMNVRELEQCLAAACVLAEDGVITPDDLPPAIAGALATGSEREDAPADLDAAPGGGTSPAEGADPRARLAALIAEHEGNLSAVARVLRTSRSQVQRLMARYGIAGKSP